MLSWQSLVHLPCLWLGIQDPMKPAALEAQRALKLVKSLAQGLRHYLECIWHHCVWHPSRLPVTECAPHPAFPCLFFPSTAHWGPEEESILLSGDTALLSDLPAPTSPHILGNWSQGS